MHVGFATIDYVIQAHGIIQGHMLAQFAIELARAIGSEGCVLVKRNDDKSLHVTLQNLAKFRVAVVKIFT